MGALKSRLKRGGRIQAAKIGVPEISLGMIFDGLLCASGCTGWHKGARLRQRAKHWSIIAIVPV